MIIDMHGHPTMKFYMGKPVTELGVDPKSKYVPPKDQAEATSRMMKDISRMVKDMDKASIDKRVLLTFGKDLDPKFNYAESDLSTGVTTPSSNEWVHTCMEKYPDRFLGFACIDPSKEGAIEELEQTISEYNFKGVKLFPCHHYYEANDKKIYPFYEKCVELGICVSYHMGYTGSPIDRLRLQSPLTLDDVARDFPKLNIIICHIAGHWFQEATLVALGNPNVYVDLAWIHGYCNQLVIPTEPSFLIKRVVGILRDSKVLYGTDNDEKINNIFWMKGIGLKEESLRKIMGENAARLLNIPLE